MVDLDLLIVGAGPGGATTAAHAARRGLRTLVLDQATFPRDKVCGDAVSGKSVDALRRLGLMDRFAAMEPEGKTLGSWGVTFSGPYGDEVAIPFTKMLDAPQAPGFICDRVTFDNELVEEAERSGATVWQETKAKGLLFADEGDARKVVGVEVERGGETVQLRAPLVVGADGPYGVTARDLGMKQLVEKHYCGGVRAYYEGVTGFHDLNFIELHFVDEAIPGYFWIFPMGGGRANVGLGMLSSEIKKGNVKLKALLDRLVAHPRFAHRFQNARRLGPTRGWGLPLGSKPRPLAGDGWMLVGDAGSLIDPFTGEGIGNAMISGERAAEWAEKAHQTGDFSGGFLEGYEAAVLRYLGGELRLSHAMQRLSSWKWLLNKVIQKAHRSPELADYISTMFDDEAQRKQLVSPMFYLRVLTA
jgi:geranylgeranyl reductase family protein